MNAARQTVRRSAVSLSAGAEINQEFFIALGPEQRRFRDAYGLVAEDGRAVLDLTDHAHMFFGRAHHPALAHFAFTDFELGFDQSDDLVARGEKLFDTGQDQLERNERSVDGGELGSIR